MGGIFQSLEIARKALWTSQAALNITANNIANINTPGYSRQRAELSSSSPIDFGFGPIGTGVLINSITRSRSALLDGNLRVSYTRSGYAQTEETMLTQLDSILREPGEGGLANIMNEFFNEWSNAANNPESSSSRDVLLQKGINLANTFNRIYQQMNNQRAQVANESQSTVGQMNQVLEQLANLNKKINYSEVSGGQANDLRDKRDLLLDKLSEYGKVNFV
ncbi:MAG: flagellar hook-associated protein FlgK, partial [Calditrichia bacterium]|nr:flagellar hook-associated protein FlgK [Calditrichia bacterium]